MDRHARLRKAAASMRTELERLEADAMTEGERATSLMETLLKMGHVDG